MNGRLVTLIVVLSALALLVVVPMLWPSGNDPAIDLSDAALADLDAFVAALDTAEPAAVRSALRELPRRHPARSAEVMTAIIDKSGKTNVREAALIGWRNAGRIDPALLTRLLRNDDTESIRVLAADTIAQQDAWDAIPALLDAMRGPSRRLRVATHAAATQMLGADIPFDPDAGPAHWQDVARQYDRYWRGLAEYRDMQLRLREAQDGRGS